MALLSRLQLLILYAAVLITGSAYGATGKVVLLVLNGFSADYLDDQSVSLPNVANLLNDGVLVKDILPEFPASTLPYLAALANGKHSLENQVVGLQWYDTVSEKIISADKDTDNLFWKKVKSHPLIWVRTSFFYSLRVHHAVDWIYFLRILKT